jgi:lipoate---protein ligase
MNGECKPPGGHLAAADVEVACGQLASVQVSGDFFRVPGDALHRLNAALAWIPVSGEASASTALVTAAPGDAVLAGFAAEAVAAAVRRAVTRASGCRDHDWRFIREEPRDPELHMAPDEALAREVGAGRLRIREWPAPAVVGSFQSLRNAVDAAEASRLGITVVRRVSGGGAMFAAPGNTITHSLCAPESLVAGMSYAGDYRLDDWVSGALTEDPGPSAWCRPLNDIASAHGRIGGAARTRLAGGIVPHHVTMAYDIDTHTMTRVLRTGREKLSCKVIGKAAKRVEPLRRQTRLPGPKIIDTLAAHFRRRYGPAPAPVTGGELHAARDLARTKPSGGEWTARLP